MGSGVFEKCLGTAKSIEADGMDLYDVCLAAEMDRCALSYSKKLKRSKSAVKKLNGDLERLFGISMKALRGSFGASTPKDIAESVICSYVKFGMDPIKVEMFMKKEEFATLCEKEG